MIRSVGALSLAFVLLASARPAAAVPMVTDDAPNVPNIINMYLLPGGPATFSTTAPTFILNVPNATFEYNVSTDGTFAQLRTTADYTTFTSAFVWNQGFVENGTAFTLEWQEVQYTYAVGGGGTIDAGQVFSRVLNGSSAPAVNAPSTLQGPVPEPSLLVLLGMGAAGLALKGRRRKQAAQS